MANKTYLNWTDVDNSIESICNKLKDKKFGTIVGLARGGMIPAAILSYKLDCKNLQQLGISTRDLNKLRYYSTPMNLKGDVLVVDDINDSGMTFTMVERYLDLIFANNEDVGTITYCSLYKRYNTRRPDAVYGSFIDNDNWLVFPWD